MSYLRPKMAGLSGIQSQPPGPRIARVALQDDAVTGSTSPTPTPAAVAAATTSTAAPAPTSSPSYLTYALYGAAAYFGYKLLFKKKSEPQAA